MMVNSVMPLSIVGQFIRGTCISDDPFHTLRILIVHNQLLRVNRVCFKLPIFNQFVIGYCFSFNLLSKSVRNLTSNT